MKKRWITVLRRISVIFVSLFFVLSYRLDIQILEGCLSGSRFIGFHLIDPFITLEVLATHNAIPVNLIIGTVTIVLFYLAVGGRAFCGWVCPYGLISELGEKLHFYLIKKNLIKGGRSLPINRYWFFTLWLGLSIVSGLLVFEIFNVVGILSRFLIYGASAAIIMVILVFVGEVLFVRRFWCRNVCPIGSAYGLLNYISAGRLVRVGNCNSCGRCSSGCIEPEQLLTFKGVECSPDGKPLYIKGSACTLCGRCIESCPKGSIRYISRFKNLV
ncbi:MAG: NapH/MauN family ferredoxin-type protein [Deferribacterales bacterium]|nr:NapH/MauN family ferredoxin-type protein [Deferribacterales bacterium]